MRRCEEVALARRRLVEGDTPEVMAAMRRRRLSRAEGGAAMFSLDDVQRGKKIAEGWPWESDPLMTYIAIGASLGVVLIGGIAVAIPLFVFRKRKPPAKRRGGGDSQLGVEAPSKLGEYSPKV